MGGNLPKSQGLFLFRKYSVVLIPTPKCPLSNRSRTVRLQIRRQGDAAAMSPPLHSSSTKERCIYKLISNTRRTRRNEGESTLCC
jgi:hypothetical protein